jgi:RNA polymerase primary sigma factor
VVYLLTKTWRVDRENSSVVLDTGEIRLLAEGKLEDLVDFAVSPRIHLADLHGNTPLHIVAGLGNISLCKLFLQSGANPALLNKDLKTPADLALAAGHNRAAELLYSLFSTPQRLKASNELSAAFVADAASVRLDAVQEHPFVEAEDNVPIDTRGDIYDLLSFEAEVEQDAPPSHYSHKSISATFVPLVSSASTVSDSEFGNWHLDLSPAQILGEGIGSSAIVVASENADNDFLHVRNRGRQSVKRATIQTGTRLAIDEEICILWVEDILAKGWCSFCDIDDLVTFCKGNGEPDDLRVNLQRTVEASGFDLVEKYPDCNFGLFDAKSDVATNELAEAIHAELTRSTRLPGTQRFQIDKTDESLLVEPMVKLSKELNLGILASEPAIRLVLSIFEKVLEGSIEPRALTIRSVNIFRREEIETATFIRAGEDLNAWSADGRILNGKHRRAALKALQEIDLTLEFQHVLISLMSKHEQYAAEASGLGILLAKFELARERLVLSHLPYVRRFASRNVAEGEDTEDVFQVTFIGMLRSIRRFDPERGHRFMVYATYWMRQALNRWRADEGSAIRVPVHRQEVVSRFDKAIELLDIRVDELISDRAVAAELGLSIQDVRQLRSIPRRAEYPEDAESWDILFPPEHFEDPTTAPEATRIVDNLLAELPKRQAEIMRMRFGIGRDAEMTLAEIGKLHGVTRERIRQIEAKALLFLSHPVRRRLLQSQLGK